MTDSNTLALYQNSDDIEAKRLFPTTIPRNPYCRGAAQLTLLPPVHSLYRVPKELASTRFDLDEGNNSAPLRDEVEISVTVPKAAIEDAPPLVRQPDGGDPLTLRSKHL